MVTPRRLVLIALASWFAGCSAFGPDDREHRYRLRLVADQVTSVEYEIEVFADDDGRAVRVVGLFQADLLPLPSIHELNEVATGSPGYLGVKVEGVRVERLIVGSAGGMVTVELQRDGETLHRQQLTGAGARLNDLRAGKTF